jgi:hypothetical protein
MAQIRILLYRNGPDPRSGSGFKVFGVWVLLEYCRIRVQGLCVIVCVRERVPNRVARRGRGEERRGNHRA